jgi:hypothetical protein
MTSWSVETSPHRAIVAPQQAVGASEGDVMERHGIVGEGDMPLVSKELTGF